MPPIFAFAVYSCRGCVNHGKKLHKRADRDVPRTSGSPLVQVACAAPLLFPLGGQQYGIRLDLLQSLHVMHAGDLADTVHDFLEVFQIGDFEDHVYAGLAVLAASFYVADVGVGVAD